MSISTPNAVIEQAQMWRSTAIKHHTMSVSMSTDIVIKTLIKEFNCYTTILHSTNNDSVLT